MGPSLNGWNGTRLKIVDGSKLQNPCLTRGGGLCLKKVWQTATRRRGAGFLALCRPTANNSFLSLAIRCARPRGGGRGFRLPLPTPSGLPTHPNDQGLNPGPKRGSRSVQRPKKHSHACPWKLQRSPNGGTGVFLDGLCPPLRFYMRPLFAGAARRKNWLSARGLSRQRLGESRMLLS